MNRHTFCLLNIRVNPNAYGDRRPILESTKQILLVDDEVDFLFSASIALRKAGFRVGATENGREALSMIVEAKKNMNPYDLLVTDIRMPGMSGLELIDAVKRCGMDIPVFAITCYSDADLVREIKIKGCEGVIDKPFTPEELVDRIKGILDSSHQAVP